MSKKQMQKTKLLELYDYLFKYTDEEHGATAGELISHLDACGISCERKSLYSDIEALRSWGADIVMYKQNGRTEYFLASRTFESAELKMLVDIIGASRFVTEKKSRALIDKLETLCSVHDAGKLTRQVLISGRVKAENEIIYLNVDKIHTAMSEERAVSFKYFNYTWNKEKSYRRGGRFYEVVPIALLWNHDNYYLVAFDREAQDTRHLRVDKMESVRLLDKISDSERERSCSFDTARFTKSVFEMYSGEVTRVELSVPEALVGSMFDRFGMDIVFRKSESQDLVFSVEVELSPLFYAWLSSFEGEVRILSPQSAVDSHRAHIEKMAKSLKGE